jgi:hypothetical protein
LRHAGQMLDAKPQSAKSLAWSFVTLSLKQITRGSTLRGGCFNSAEMKRL